MERDAFFQRHASRSRYRSFLPVSKEDKAHRAMTGIKAQPGGKLLGTSDGRGGPKGSKTSLVGGEQQILHCTGGAAEFVQPGNIAFSLHMGGDRNNNLGLTHVFTELGTLFRAYFGHRSKLVVNTLECVGQTNARFAREDMKSPRLGESVGGRPMSILKDLKEQISSNCTATIHQSWFDGAPGAVGKISAHEKSEAV